MKNHLFFACVMGGVALAPLDAHAGRGKDQPTASEPARAAHPRLGKNPGGEFLKALSSHQDLQDAYKTWAQENSALLPAQQEVLGKAIAQVVVAGPSDPAQTKAHEGQSFQEQTAAFQQWLKDNPDNLQLKKKDIIWANYNAWAEKNPAASGFPTFLPRWKIFSKWGDERNAGDTHKQPSHNEKIKTFAQWFEEDPAKLWQRPSRDLWTNYDTWLVDNEGASTEGKEAKLAELSKTYFETVRQMAQEKSDTLKRLSMQAQVALEDNEELTNKMKLLDDIKQKSQQIIETILADLADLEEKKADTEIQKLTTQINDLEDLEKNKGESEERRHQITLLDEKLDQARKRLETIQKEAYDYRRTQVKKERDDAYQVWLAQNPQASKKEQEEKLGFFSTRAGHPRLKRLTGQIQEVFREKDLRPSESPRPSELLKLHLLQNKRSVIDGILRDIWQEEDKIWEEKEKKAAKKIPEQQPQG
ncbi:hypothetical protein [Candidatus Hepatobacter penaei]|uniref:hypothetical protein n=1 Tax=Candidatus Hepatobacter penaei TaxID=1274402 RepID=UPI0012E06A59|nr:hypothetical protein [Candidatus Hepatobacter penaei]